MLPMFVHSFSYLKRFWTEIRHSVILMTSVCGCQTCCSTCAVTVAVVSLHYLYVQGSPRDKETKAWWVGVIWAEFLAT